VRLVSAQTAEPAGLAGAGRAELLLCDFAWMDAVSRGWFDGWGRA